MRRWPGRTQAPKGEARTGIDPRVRSVKVEPRRLVILGLGEVERKVDAPAALPPTTAAVCSLFAVIVALRFVSLLPAGVRLLLLVIGKGLAPSAPSAFNDALRTASAAPAAAGSSTTPAPSTPAASSTTRRRRYDLAPAPSAAQRGRRSGRAPLRLCRLALEQVGAGRRWRRCSCGCGGCGAARGGGGAQALLGLLHAPTAEG
jgi:hypothetical protein